MSVVPITFEGTDTSRTPSASIWGRCPWQAIQAGLVDGSTFYDDFTSWPITPPTTEGNWGQYSMFSSTGGTAANLSATTLGGVLAIGSDGDNEGAGIRTTSTPFQVSQSMLRSWGEARIQTSTVTAAKHDFFFGLLENVALTATVPITATADTLSDNNLFGFKRVGSVGTQVDSVYTANGVTAVTVQASVATIAAATWVKLGWKYEPSGDKDGKYTLSFYVNGARATTSYQVVSAAGTDFPNDVALGPVFAVLNQTATTPGTSSIDWWKFAQVYS